MTSNVTVPKEFVTYVKACESEHERQSHLVLHAQIGVLEHNQRLKAVDITGVEYFVGNRQGHITNMRKSKRQRVRISELVVSRLQGNHHSKEELMEVCRQFVRYTKRGRKSRHQAMTIGREETLIVQRRFHDGGADAMKMSHLGIT